MRWDLLEQYDVQGLDKGEFSVSAADDEVTGRLKQKALFNKHYSQASDGDKKDE